MGIYFNYQIFVKCQVETENFYLTILTYKITNTLKVIKKYSSNINW